MAKNQHSYRDMAGGPVQEAFGLRLSGLSYARIAEHLRRERPDECGELTEATVANWSRTRLHWDTVIELMAAHRAETMPSAASPQSAERLAEVRVLIERIQAAMTRPSGDPADEFEAFIARFKIRPDTFLLKLYQEERTLSWGDLAAIPKTRIQKVVTLIVAELVRVLIDMGLVSQHTISGKANQVESAVLKRMPDILRSEALRERMQ